MLYTPVIGIYPSHWVSQPPTANSRFDFALTRKNAEHQSVTEYMEVKSVTLADENKGFFPDAVTQRGAKHCLELARLSDSGIKTNLLFCVQHTAIERKSEIT